MFDAAKLLEKYPFIRLLIPLMAGILCGDVCPEAVYPYGLFGVGIGAVCLCFSYKKPLQFGAFLYLFLFLTGAQLLFYQKLKVKVNWSENKELYSGLLTDNPQEKARSYLLPVEVDKHDVLLYVPKDSIAKSMKRGDKIVFYARIDSPDIPPVPGQFDYGRYLQRKGISGRAYAGAGYWKPLETETLSLPFKLRALNVRDKLLSRYRELGFRGDELAVLSALTLGDKSELKEDIKETYSITGASHVLALSGLHLGIIYGICTFLLSFLYIGKATRWVRMICIVAFLWGFSFMVGLAPSVVRSASMFSLFTIGQCLQRRSLSINTLALSAFFMLVYQPFYLFDVGFQMSYAAVASILLFNPIVSAWWKPSNRLLRYIWGIISVSLVAQIGVAPLIICYFSRFSVYFLLTNLVVIPITFCLIAGSVVMLLCGFYFPLQKAIAMLLNEILKGMHSVLVGIEQMPFSAIDKIKAEPISIVCFYLFVIFLLLYYKRRHARSLIGALSCMVCVMFMHFLSLLPTKTSQLLFYHSQEGASVQCTYKGKEPFELFSSDETSSLHCFLGKTIVLLKDNHWDNYSIDKPLSLDYLFIQKGFTGKLSDLQHLFEIHKVVLDTSLSAYWQQRISEECSELGIEVFLLSEKGYLLVEV